MDIRRYEPNFLWDEPCEYKEVLLYPALMHEYHHFYTSLQCLNLPKNRSKDIKVIKMTYFDYLFYLAEEEEQSIYLSLLSLLLTIVFKNQTVRFIDFADGIYGFGVTKEDGTEVTFNGVDFEEIKSIILAQNSVTLPEIELNEEIEKELEKARRIKDSIEKKNNSIGLEELALALMIYTGLSFEKIKQMSLRKFNLAIERMTMLEDYRVYKSAEVSGMVEFKESIPHWLSKVVVEEKDKDLKVAPESLQNKLKDVANFTKEMKLDGSE